MKPLSLLLSVGMLAACNPWERSTQYWGDSKLLWDANVVAAGDGLYIRLPSAGQLVRVEPDGTFSTIDMDGATPDRFVATPDGEGVLVFASWTVCEDPDPKIVTLADCPNDQRTVQRELNRIVGTTWADSYDVPGHLNALTFSNDGRTAVAYLDYTSGMDIDVNGLIDLGEVMFIPIDNSGEPRSMSVGFSPEKVLFGTDASGVDTKAVVFSRSEVLVVDIATLQTLVTYPLVLDADQVVDPQDAALTTDGTVALVAVQGSSDLYELDLERYSIDLEELDSVPGKMVNAVLPGIDDGDDADVTLIAYPSLSRVDVLDHSTLELREPLLLEQPTSDMLVTPQSALLFNKYNDSAKDIYFVDLATYDIQEFRVANPIEELILTPNENFALGTMREEYSSSYGNDLEVYQDEHWGLAVLDLAQGTTANLVLEKPPVGLALIASESSTFGLVLMDGIDTLLQIDLAEPTFFTEVALPAPPIQIGRLNNDLFYITHDSALGLISFLEPNSASVTTIGGFATPGLLNEPTLPRRAAQ